MAPQPIDINKDIAKLEPIMQQALAELGKSHTFKVTEGLRSLERQKMLKETGKSWTLKSRHLVGFAADLYPYPDGYKSNPEVWIKLHNDWDRIVLAYAYHPEPRIDRDLNHFGILGPL